MYDVSCQTVSMAVMLRPRDSHRQSRMHHDGSLSRLDMIAEPSERSRLSAPATVLVGLSDHRLLKAVLRCTRPPAPSVIYTYCDLKSIDVPAFCAYLRQSPSVTSPSEDPDEIVR